MKLKKYENKELRKSKIISFIFCCLFIIFVGLFIYQSYARYQDKVTFKLINGKLKMSGGSGDIEFAFYNGDQKLDTMPIKNNDEGIVFIKSECTNDAILKWNDDDWDNIVINNLKQTKTSCTLYFGSKDDRACLFYPEGAACKYYKKGETSELLYDDTEDKNLRYVGTTPNNYVYFNCEEGKKASKETCETWRIIGIMNNIEDENGNIGSHIKIIRDKFDTLLSWDSSASGVNNGYGVNEWSEADIEKVLNDEYLNRRVGTNICYDGYRNTIETCPDWANIGIRDNARNMISNIKWNTGTMSVSFSDDYKLLLTASYAYKAERSNHTGKERCKDGGNDCNDKVTRTTIWIGKVGLMYPSDYGYAVGGEVRETCLEKSTIHYHSYNCEVNNWLYDSNHSQHTMTPSPNSTNANYVFDVGSDGGVGNSTAAGSTAIRPTLYLKSDVKIIDRDYEDYGSSIHPFELSYE